MCAGHTVTHMRRPVGTARAALLLLGLPLLLAAAATEAGYAAVQPGVQSSSNSSDAELLLELKACFENSDSADVLGSWRGSDPCDGTWLGISCTDKRVTTM